MMHYEQHAKEVVARFQKMLSEDALEVVTEEHFGELETLVAAALGVVDAKNNHDFAKALETLAHEYRTHTREVD